MLLHSEYITTLFKFLNHLILYTLFDTTKQKFDRKIYCLPILIAKGHHYVVVGFFFLVLLLFYGL
jgi:hypothetical protein